MRERATEPLGRPQSAASPQTGTILWYGKGVAFGGLIISILVGIVDGFVVPQEMLPGVLILIGVVLFGFDRLTRKTTP